MRISQQYECIILSRKSREPITITDKGALGSENEDYIGTCWKKSKDAS